MANVPGPSCVAGPSCVPAPVVQVVQPRRRASVAGCNLFSVQGSVAETGFDHMLTARQAVDQNVPGIQLVMPNNGPQIQPRQIVPFDPFVRFRNPPFALAGRRRSVDSFQRMPTVLEDEAENAMELGTPNNSAASNISPMSIGSPNTTASSITSGMASVDIIDDKTTPMDTSGDADSLQK